MYVPSVDDQNQESWRLLVEERSANIGKLETSFYSEHFNDFSFFQTFLVFGYLRRSLLYIVVELAG